MELHIRDIKAQVVTSEPTPPASQQSNTATPIPKPEEVTLNFEQFSGSGDTEVYLKRMIDEYTKVNSNVTVELQTIGYGDYFNQMMAKLAADQAPDVFELNYENFVSYAKKDVIKPLGDCTKTRF